MILVGTMGGTRTELDMRPFIGRRISVRGTALRSRSLEEKALATRAFERSVVPHIGAGRLKVVIDRVFPLAEATAAQTYMGTNANFGKVVLEMP
jgi:NADPH:quinone reductase-like Zn-dependent oxidoreductase